MINIFKSQNYQLRHDMFSVIAVIILTIVSFYMAFFDSVTGGEKYSFLGEQIPMLWIAICLIFGARIAAWDFNDKTINYELMMGHSRKTMYWGRFLTALLWCFVLCMMVVVIPLMASSLRNGWGNNVDFVNAISRLLLAILPMIRVLSEFFLLAMLLRNCYATYALGYALIGGSLMVALVLMEFFEADITYLLGYTNLSAVLELTNGHKELINGVDTMVLDSVVTAQLWISTVCSSLGVSLVCLFLGYGIFKKRDFS